jgi:hypothetical protein
MLNAMSTDHREAEMRAEGASGTVECPNCRSLLTAGLRFCRHCGYRLGEGVEEYAETRRFDGTMPTGFAPGPAAPSAQQASMPGQWGAMAPMPLTQTLEPVKPSSVGRACRRLGSSWVMWMVLVLAVLTAGGVISNGIWGGRRSGAERAATPKSYLEVDGFETADGGGAFIEGLKTSNTSLERAGLRGGDTITGWDGKTIPNARALQRAVAATPVGKTVEVIFRRDGVTGRTPLTTISDRGFSDTLAERPGGRGFLGVERSGMERKHVPSTNTHGVELTDVRKNEPGYIAGLRDGDIVLEFGGKPVSTPGDLRLRIYEALPDTVVNVVFMRDGQRMEIPVKMGGR